MLVFASKARRREKRQTEYRDRLDRLSRVTTTAAHSDNDGLLVTVVLASKPDPQRGVPIDPDYAAYIRPWWTTVNRVGLQGVILHDGLPEPFIAEATTDRIRFERVSTGDLPILHDRHFLVRDYLQRVTHEYVLVTDVSDVAIKRDPFALMLAEPDRRLFIGSEIKTIGRNRCLQDELKRQYGAVSHRDRHVVNPGILGGRREDVLRFLDLLTAEIDSLRGRLVNSDMSIINKVVHDHYLPDDIGTGFPLHSRFRKWEFETEAAVMHK